MPINDVITGDAVAASLAGHHHRLTMADKQHHNYLDVA